MCKQSESTSFWKNPSALTGTIVIILYAVAALALGPCVKDRCGPTTWIVGWLIGFPSVVSVWLLGLMTYRLCAGGSSTTDELNRS